MLTRLQNGDYRYRGQRIKRHRLVSPGVKGRYSVDGKLFAQRGHAVEYIDNLMMGKENV